MSRHLGWLAIAPLLLAAGCRHTRVEVATRVDMQGGATRTITVTSDDDGAPADHPNDFQPGTRGYAVLQSAKGRHVAQGVFGSIDAAPSAFGFSGRSGQAAGGSATRFRKTDWVLFHHFLYSEVVRDVVDSDTVKAGLDEVSQVFAELLEKTFRELFGADFDDAILRKRLRTDLREMLRELVFVAWQELQYEESSFVDVDPDRFVARVSRVLARYGLELSPKVLRVSVEGNLDDASPEMRAFRGEIARWVEDGLRSVEKGDRVILVPNLEFTLFNGPFAMAFQETLRKKFGGEKQAERWFDELWDQVFGIFGPNRADLTFHFRVKLPGTLLRSNGYLQDDGWTFLEFPAGDIYPDGQGIQCESVVWEPSVMGVLPIAALVQDNETALQWTWVLGSGPESAPRPELVQWLRRCTDARSFDPLHDGIEALEAARDGQKGSHDELEQMQGLLDWLEGERE